MEWLRSWMRRGELAWTTMIGWSVALVLTLMLLLIIWRNFF